MTYHELQPEVAGGWGAHTQADTSCHPPIVSRLHYEFDGWLGDCLLESFPCFIATESVIAALADGGMTGFEVSDVEISLTQEFRGQYPDRDVGHWRWLRPTASPGEADIAVSKSCVLVVSARALQVFKAHGLFNCTIQDHKGEQAGGCDGEEPPS